MKNKQIVSSLLPGIPGIAKDLVNYGKWFLYKIVYDENTDAKYVLSTNNSDFLLNAVGEIISPLPKNADIRYIYLLTFEDLPIPQTPNFIAL